MSPGQTVAVVFLAYKVDLTLISFDDTAYVKAGIGYKTVLVVNIGENGFFIGKLAVFVNNGEKHFILVLMLEGTHNIFKAHTVDNVFRVLHGEVF